MMKSYKWMPVAIVLVLLVFPANLLAEKITVNWWFAHGGRLGEKVQEIVSNFNKSQDQYSVVATYKGKD